MRLVFALFAIAILAMMGLAGYQAALENAGEDRTVTNETWTPDAGNITELDDSKINGAYYDDEVDVYNDTGVPVDEGSDYEWFPTNGTVKAVTGGALDGEASATITYSYQETTGEERNVTALLAHQPQFMGYLLFVLLFLVFVGVLRGGL